MTNPKSFEEWWYETYGGNDKDVSPDTFDKDAWHASREELAKEVCEMEYEQWLNYYKFRCGHTSYLTLDQFTAFKFCPFCGRKIVVMEDSK